MIKKIWSCDMCHTIKSCASVVLIGAAVSMMILVIRLVGEKRLQRFLNTLLFSKRRQSQLELASDAFAPDNRI